MTPHPRHMPPMASVVQCRLIQLDVDLISSLVDDRYAYPHPSACRSLKTMDDSRSGGTVHRHPPFLREIRSIQVE